MPLRVVIADDHSHYRRALARMLRSCGADVVAEVPNGEAAVRAVAATGADVVLMDLYMPGVSGVEATRLIVRRSPGTAVLMLSVFSDEAEIVEAMVGGASGYVLKDRPVEELLAAARSAAAGRPVVSPGLASALLQRFRDRARSDGSFRAPLAARS
jgi:DNA-binding NarL/FixJ family response regulator